MVIVINTTSNNGFDGESFIINLFEQLAVRQPDHRFYFISSPNVSRSLDNYITLKHHPNTSKGKLNRIKYHFEIKKTIKLISPDVVITPFLISGLKSTTRQYLLIGQIGASKNGNTHLKNLKKFTGIITSSKAWCEVFKTQGVASEKVLYVKPFSEYEYSDEVSLNAVPENEENNDFPYLLLIDNNADPNRIVSVLKAFSAFKKMLKSSMKILIPVRDNNKITLENVIKSYKYRNDVLLIPELGTSTLSSVASKSYAVIVNSDEYGFTNPTSSLIAAGTVIIASNNIYNSVKEYAGDNAFYYSNGNYGELSDILIRLYKDEELRNLIVSKNKVDFDKEKEEQLEVLARKLLVT